MNLQRVDLVIGQFRRAIAWKKMLLAIDDRILNAAAGGIYAPFT